MEAVAGRAEGCPAGGKASELPTTPGDEEVEDLEDMSDEKKFADGRTHPDAAGACCGVWVHHWCPQ